MCVRFKLDTVRDTDSFSWISSVFNGSMSRGSWNLFLCPCKWALRLKIRWLNKWTWTTNRRTRPPTRWWMDDVHANHYYVHGPVAGQGELKSQKFSKAAHPKKLRLIQNQWIWPSLTQMCLQARVVALQELHKAMSRWICLFFNSISKFLNLSFYQNCRKIIVLDDQNP